MATIKKITKKKLVTKKKTAVAKKSVAKKAPTKKVAIKKVATKKKTSVSKKSTVVTKKNKGKYFYAVGRRKTSRAKVWLSFGEGKLKVNGKSLKVYFPRTLWRFNVKAPLKLMGQYKRFDVNVIVSGGGINAQSEAVRHGIARALLSFNSDFRKKLKKAGFIKRDPRQKERKKPGLKRARRAPQFSKR